MSEFLKKMEEEAYQARINEVEEYHFNTENYASAIELIGDDPELQEFKEQLIELRESTLREQRKAEVMLAVIKKRRGE